MDIRVMNCKREIAKTTLSLLKDTSHIDYFHQDGSVELTINNVKCIMSDEKTDDVIIISNDDKSITIPYMDYYQINIC